MRGARGFGLIALSIAAVLLPVYAGISGWEPGALVASRRTIIRKTTSSSSSAKSSSSALKSVASKASTKLGFGVDPLPMSDPKFSMLVLGNPSPVIEKCSSMVVNFSDKHISETFAHWTSPDIIKVMAYDMATKKQIATGVKGADGKFIFTESDEALLPEEKNVKGVYFRWQMRPYDEKLRFGESFNLKTKCDPAGKVIPYTIVHAGVTDILAAGPQTDVLTPLNHVPLGTFTVVAQRSATNQYVWLKSLRLQGVVTGKVKFTNVRLKSEFVAEEVPCLSNEWPTVDCSSIPDYVGILGDKTNFTVYGDVQRTGPGLASVQLKVDENFGTAQAGGTAVSWQTNFGTYRIMTPTQTLIKGTLYQ